MEYPDKNPRWMYGVIKELKEKNIPENLREDRNKWRLRIWGILIHMKNNFDNDGDMMVDMMVDMVVVI